MKKSNCLFIGLFMFGMCYLCPVEAKNKFWGLDPFKLSYDKEKKEGNFFRGQFQVNKFENSLNETQRDLDSQNKLKRLSRFQLQGVWALGLNKKAYISGQMYQVGDYVEDLMVAAIQEKKVVLKDVKGRRYDLSFKKINYVSDKILKKVK